MQSSHDTGHAASPVFLRFSVGLGLACLGVASGARKPESTAPEVTIYVLSGSTASSPILNRAKLTASKLFTGIGVQIAWRGQERGSPSDLEGAIEMQLDFQVPDGFHPGALAYSLPYGVSGTRIHVMIQRALQAPSPELAGIYLGYTLTHEITHVLEGISRHSAEGIMKAKWNDRDFGRMVSRSLGFASEDADLIRRALDRRKQSRKSPGGDQ